MVEVVRADAAPQSGRTLHRAVPVSRGADAQLLRQRGHKLLHCFGCGKGGDVITFVRETENLDFAEAVEWLAERFRVTLEYEETSPRSRSRASGATGSTPCRPRGVVLRAPPLGVPPARRFGPISRAGLGEAVCQEFRLAFAGHRVGGEGGAEGLHGRRAARRRADEPRGNDYFPQRLMFPLADARGRIVGFQARKLRDDDPLHGKYVNSPESEPFHKSAILYGLHLARRSQSRSAPSSSRGTRT